MGSMLRGSEIGQRNSECRDGTFRQPTQLRLEGVALTSIIIRGGQVLATGALVVGIACGLQPTAVAAPSSTETAFLDCIDAIPAGDTDRPYKFWKCCQDNGGTPGGGNDRPSCALSAPPASNPGNGAPSSKPVPPIQRAPDVGASPPATPTTFVMPPPARPGSVG
jgi:hypothetical protein